MSATPGSPDYPSAIPSIPNTGWTHAGVADEITAIAAELGTNPSGAHTTVKARLDASAPVLLLEAGASVPAGTAVGTIVFQKA